MPGDGGAVGVRVGVHTDANAAVGPAQEGAEVRSDVVQVIPVHLELALRSHRSGVLVQRGLLGVSLQNLDVHHRHFHPTAMSSCALWLALSSISLSAAS